MGCKIFLCLQVQYPAKKLPFRPQPLNTTPIITFVGNQIEEKCSLVFSAGQTWVQECVELIVFPKAHSAQIHPLVSLPHKGCAQGGKSQMWVIKKAETGGDKCDFSDGSIRRGIRLGHRVAFNIRYTANKSVPSGWKKRAVASCRLAEACRSTQSNKHGRTGGQAMRDTPRSPGSF